jgi:hypothetical protein
LCNFVARQPTVNDRRSVVERWIGPVHPVEAPLVLDRRLIPLTDQSQGRLAG